ncbi:MAG: diguanylate cyclase [Firmicutes bacterium]|nr:diguanylate cyclase [Bacillota bacterium]
MEGRGWEELAAWAATLSDGLLLTDPAERILYANPAFEALSGWSKQALLGHTPRLLQAPESDRQALSTVHHAVADARPCCVEVLNRRPDGSRFWNQFSLTPLRDPQGQLIGWLSLHRDVTAYKTALEERQQAHERLRVMALFYHALAETRQWLRQTDHEAPEVLSEWCDRLVHWVEARLAFVGRLEVGSRAVRVVAAAGPALGYLDGLIITDDPERPEGRGPAGHALRTLSTASMAIANPAFAPWRQRAEAYGIGAALASAAALGNGARVVLGLYRPAGQPELRELEELMARLVREVADFFDRAAQAEVLRRFEQYREAYRVIQNQLLEAEESEEIFTLLVETLARSTDAQFADVLIPHRTQPVLQRIRAAGPLAHWIGRFPPAPLALPPEGTPIPLPTRVWHSAQPVIIRYPGFDPSLPALWHQPPLSELGVVSGWAVPQAHQSTPAAVVSIGARDPDTFTPELRQLIAEIVRSAALALGKAAHRRQVERLQRYQRAALQAQHEFLQLPDALSLYRQVVTLLTQETDCLGAYVVTPNPDHPRLRMAAVSARDESLANALISLTPSQDPDDPVWGDLICSRAFRTGQAMGPESPLQSLALHHLITRDPRWAALEAVAAWPVSLRGAVKPEAVLTILSDDRDYFTPALMQLLRQLVESLRLALEQQRTQQEMALWAQRDPLTGLPNRRGLDAYLESALARAHEQGQRLAVCLLDLDDFKPVNDSYGHAAGDSVLQAVANRLREALGPKDFVARLGGDEFVLICEELRGDALQRTMRSVAENLARPYRELPGVMLHASLGVALYPDHGRRPQDLLRHADQALYQVKAHKRQRQHFWSLYGSEIEPGWSPG